MIVDDVANTIRTAIELKLKATPVHTEYDSVKADGVDTVSYTHLTLPTKA